MRNTCGGIKQIQWETSLKQSSGYKQTKLKVGFTCSCNRRDSRNLNSKHRTLIGRAKIKRLHNVKGRSSPYPRCTYNQNLHGNQKELIYLCMNIILSTYGTAKSGIRFRLIASPATWLRPHMMCPGIFLQCQDSTFDQTNELLIGICLSYLYLSTPLSIALAITIELDFSTGSTYISFICSLSVSLQSKISEQSFQ